MIHFRIITIFLIICFSHQAYVPEAMIISSTQFFNAQISHTLGPLITKLIENYTIPDQHIDEKVQGVHVTANLSKINLTLGINWKANVLQSTDRYNFTIKSNNINITLKSHIVFKVGLTPAQTGELVITAEKIQTETAIRFQQPKSSKSIGFDVQISKVFFNSESIVIKIQGKGLDNYIIQALIKLFKNRIPEIIDTAVQTKVNPKISQITSTAIIEQFFVNNRSYILTGNTTEVPHFQNQQLIFPVDITLQNQLTNATNDEIENQNLSEEHLFDKVANVTATISSNMLNTVLWLIDDAYLLHFDVFPKDLGPNPPIALNTLNLSILMPEINKKWPKKDVALRVKPATKINHLYIRNGRVISGLSLSVSFIVNLTDTSSNITHCLIDGKCVSAITLNITLPISVSINILRQNFVQGLLHGVRILSIDKIDGLINVKTETLHQIFNTIIGSSLPEVNSKLISGIDIDPSLFAKYNISGIFGLTKKDYAGLGLVLELK